MSLVAPLWGFFTHIRDRSPVPLSIDQYFYLLQAIHRMDLSYLQTKEDLLRFTKLFWLPDFRFEKQYDSAFASFMDWDSILKLKGSPAEVASEVFERKAFADKGHLEKQFRPIDEPKQKEQISIKKPESIPLVDFQLLVKETQSTTGVDEPSIGAMIPHDFALSDLAIVPFDRRHFVQRLRRKVETTEQILSDILDLPLIVSRFAETGFIDDIIYETQDTQKSKVVLLADRFGSMVAHEFLEHHFDQSLRQIPYCDYQHYFFYNRPKEITEGIHYELQPARKGAEVFYTSKHHWDRNTWFLILSDAGAHSGVVNRERMKHTMKFWKYLQSISSHVFWINPVPIEYMEDCTASRLQMSIPMVHPDQHSLNTMIFERKPLPL